MADLLTWPEGLPLPLRDGYGFRPYNNILRTEMDSGRARQRLDFEDGPTTGNLRFRFNAQEAQLFEYFQTKQVKAAWFTMELLNTGGLDRQTFKARRDQLLAEARADPTLANIRFNGL